MGVSGVSGGERRRVAIGMELVIDPQVSQHCYFSWFCCLCIVLGNRSIVAQQNPITGMQPQFFGALSVVSVGKG
jgi:hypothetical protein